MTKRSENQKIAAKIKDWDDSLVPFNTYIKKLWKELKWAMRKAFDWYFFYQARSDGDRAFHIIMWVVITIGIVGWFRLAFP